MTDRHRQTDTQTAQHAHNKSLTYIKSVLIQFVYLRFNSVFSCHRPVIDDWRYNVYTWRAIYCRPTCCRVLAYGCVCMLQIIITREQRINHL